MPHLRCVNLFFWLSLVSRHQKRDKLLFGTFTLEVKPEFSTIVKQGCQRVCANPHSRHSQRILGIDPMVNQYMWQSAAASMMYKHMDAGRTRS